MSQGISTIYHLSMSFLFSAEQEHVFVLWLDIIYYRRKCLEVSGEIFSYVGSEVLCGL